MGKDKLKSTLENGAEKIESGAKQLGIKTSHYIINAMGLVVGLSWNDTIKDAIKEYVPISRDEIRAKIFYSVVLTVVLMLIVALLPNTKDELPAETKIKVEKQELENTKKELQKTIKENNKTVEENKKIIERNEKMINEIKKLHAPY